jgi:tetratricopeptide (TPR) repeat protein
MAEMNELLEEAEGQCSALSDELDTAVAAINSLESKADTLHEHASRGVSQVRSRLQALAERLGAAESALESARQEAVSDLDALAEQATAVRTDVSDLLLHVREKLEALQDQQGQLDEAMNESMQAVGTDVSDLGLKVQETQQSIATQLQEAGQAIDTFGKAVEAAQTALGEKQTELGTALDELESAAQEKTREWVGALQTVLADQTTAMVDMANRALVKHNETMEALKKAFATEAAHQVAASIQPLQDSLELLGQRAGEHGAELTAKAEEALGRVRGALPVLEELKAAFEQSSRLG